MNADAKLARMRYMAHVAESNPLTEHGVAEFLRLFAELDSHLSQGGTPPAAWSEGPDEPYMDGPGGFQCAECGRVDIAEYVVAGAVDDKEGRTEICLPCYKALQAPSPTFDRPPVEPLGGPVPGANGSHLPE